MISSSLGLDSLDLPWCVLGRERKEKEIKRGKGEREGREGERREREGRGKRGERKGKGERKGRGKGVRLKHTHSLCLSVSLSPSLLSPFSLPFSLSLSLSLSTSLTLSLAFLVFSSLPRFLVSVLGNKVNFDFNVPKSQFCLSSLAFHTQNKNKNKTNNKHLLLPTRPRAKQTQEVVWWWPISSTFF